MERQHRALALTSREARNFGVVANKCCYFRNDAKDNGCELVESKDKEISNEHDQKDVIEPLNGRTNEGFVADKSPKQI